MLSLITVLDTLFLATTQVKQRFSERSIVAEDLLNPELVVIPPLEARDASLVMENTPIIATIPYIPQAPTSPTTNSEQMVFTGEEEELYPSPPNLPLLINQYNGKNLSVLIKILDDKRMQLSASIGGSPIDSEINQVQQIFERKSSSDGQFSIVSLFKRQIEMGYQQAIDTLLHSTDFESAVKANTILEKVSREFKSKLFELERKIVIAEQIESLAKTIDFFQHRSIPPSSDIIRQKAEIVRLKETSASLESSVHKHATQLPLVINIKKATDELSSFQRGGVSPTPQQITRLHELIKSIQINLADAIAIDEKEQTPYLQRIINDNIDPNSIHNRTIRFLAEEEAKQKKIPEQRPSISQPTSSNQTTEAITALSFTQFL